MTNVVRFCGIATPSLTLPLPGGGDAVRTAVMHLLTPSVPSSGFKARCFPPPEKGRVRVGVFMSGFRSETQKAQAKALRRQMTPVERILWHHLRAHHFMGLSVRRQAPVGPFIVDFLIPEHRLIIEADGSGHGGPRDQARDLWLADHGFRVLRLWNSDIRANLPGCLDLIANEVAQ
jgi:very-short-patch-repair endonuclease